MTGDLLISDRLRVVLMAVEPNGSVSLGRDAAELLLAEIEVLRAECGPPDGLRRKAVMMTIARGEDVAARCADALVRADRAEAMIENFGDIILDVPKPIT